MKRIVVIENDSLPSNSVDTLISHLMGTDEAVIYKEINYAQSNGRLIVDTLTKFSELTEDGDEFIIAGESTFGDIDQIEEILDLIDKLPVKPSFYFVNLEFTLPRKMKWGSRFTNKSLSMIAQLISDGLAYTVRTNDDIVDYYGQEERTVENIKKLLSADDLA